MTLSPARLSGALLLALVAAIALAGPLAVPGDPYAMDLMKTLGGPEAAAPLGYDHLGRSVFHRLAAALRLSPLIGPAASRRCASGARRATGGLDVRRCLPVRPSKSACRSKSCSSGPCAKPPGEWPTSSGRWG
nr:hypothetical protein [Mangrovicoccus ximenensis]